MQEKWFKQHISKKQTVATVIMDCNFLMHPFVCAWIAVHVIPSAPKLFFSRSPSPIPSSSHTNIPDSSILSCLPFLIDCSITEQLLCGVIHELLYTLVMPHTDSIWVSLRARQPNPSLPTQILSLDVFSRAHHRELSLESLINLPLFGCIVCIPVMSGCSAVSMLCVN